MLPQGASRLHELLDRFRRRAGVPTQHAGDDGAELAPLFRALEQLQHDAERMRRDDAQSEERADALAAARIDALLAAAKSEASRERGRVAADIVASAERRAELAGGEGAERERRIVEAGEARIPQIVAAVVRCVEESSE